VDRSGIDEDEVKMVPQWKAKGIGQIVHDEPPSKQQSTLKPKSVTSEPADVNEGWKDNNCIVTNDKCTFVS